MRNRIWLPLFLATVIWKANASELVGMTVPPYPPGLRDIGGTCLADGVGVEHVCDYSIAILANDDHDAAAEPVLRYVIAGRLAGRDGSQALWKITDAQVYPKVAKDFFWQAGSCRWDKVSDAGVVAIVRQDPDQEYLDDVAWARRLDRKTGKLTVLDAAHVDCINEGYGESP